MPNDFTRSRDGQRFQFTGMKTNARPDALPPGKYPLAVNVRSYEDGAIQTRPGISSLFSVLSFGDYITDLRAYTALDTDNLPRILAYSQSGNVWLDNGSGVGVMSPSLGASMIPFRPAASATPWMYIANGTNYRKFSAPSATNVVMQQKVGIAEPQTAPDAIISGFKAITLMAGAFVGSAGVSIINYLPSGRLSDTAGAVLRDPISGSVVYSVQVSVGIAYQRNQHVQFNGALNIVLDVFAGLSTALAISGIYYDSGATGHCVIVPANLGEGPTNSTSPQSVNDPIVLSTLRRGSLIQIDSEFATCGAPPSARMDRSASKLSPHPPTPLLPR